MRQFRAIYFGNNPRSAIICRCFGCQGELRVEYGSGYSREYAESIIVNNNWFRRNFGPGAEPWFCSFECAYNSPAAVECELYWMTLQAKELFNKRPTQVKAGLLTMTSDFHNQVIDSKGHLFWMILLKPCIKIFAKIQKFLFQRKRN